MTLNQNPQFNQDSREKGVVSTNAERTYRGRFAPSPTGPLHLGSLATALGSWLDARANNGKWLVRIEDIDTPRVEPGSDQIILQQLKACGLDWDEEVVWQSQRTHRYQAAVDQLKHKELIYGCICSRKQIEEAIQLKGGDTQRHEELVYPGTCRHRGHDLEKMALRLALNPSNQIMFTDRIFGDQAQDLNTAVGDFVLRRADGLFTYQLAVVVDDFQQGITDIVRGADLLSNTARQIHLQNVLGYSTPSYMHLPLVLNTQGEKLSKQTKALAIDTSSQNSVISALNNAADHLCINSIDLQNTKTINDWLCKAIGLWKTEFTN
jgi:glutamyl-Q tRNA(Asp) synthetase